VKQLALLLFIGLANISVGQDNRAAALQHYSAGNYKLALESINKVTPFEACDYFIKANAFQKMGQFQEAGLNYNEAKSAGCGDESLLLNDGICEYSLGNLSESVYLLKLYTHENTSNFQGYYWLVRNNLTVGHSNTYQAELKLFQSQKNSQQPMTIDHQLQKVHIN
jgi:tetratricopeptide (TPR) repeat protein